MSKHIKEKEDYLVNATRYTEEAWKTFFPNSNKEEWSFQALPDSIVDFACNAAIQAEHRKQDNINVIAVRPCVIDDEYFDWVKANGKEINSSTTVEYANTLSDNDALRLLQKNNMDVQYTACALDLVLPKMNWRYETTCKLDETTEKLMKRYLERIYGKGNIYVPGCVMDAVSVANDLSKLYDLAKEYFSSGEKPVCDLWEKQNNSMFVNGELHVFIPFIVRGKTKHPSISLKQYAGDNDIQLFPAANIAFKKDSLESKGVTGVPDINETRFFEKLSEIIFFKQIDPRPALLDDVWYSYFRAKETGKIS